MQAKGRKRAASIDAVRVLALVAVVAGHVWGTEVARDLTFTWHVPIFFLLTGYFWRPNRTFRDEVWARARTLLLPYVSWLCIVGVVYLIVSDATWIETVGRMVLGGSYLTYPFNAFWFVPALFFAALLYRLARVNTTRRRLTIAVGAAVAGTFFGPVLSKAPEGIGIALIALVFVAAGDMLRTRSAEITPAIASAALASAVVLVSTDTADSLDLKQGDVGTPVLSIAVAILISASLIVLAGKLVPDQGALPSASVEIARVGLAIVLLHGLVLYLLEGAPRMMAFLAAFVVPLVLGLAAARTRLSSPLLGVRR